MQLHYYCIITCEDHVQFLHEEFCCDINGFSDTMREVLCRRTQSGEFCAVMVTYEEVKDAEKRMREELAEYIGKWTRDTAISSVNKLKAVTEG